ncbi:MAG: TonB-dependent receptor, partial [Acidobacteriaceae bacterium]
MRRPSLLLLTAFLTSTLGLLAQTATTSLRGTITDPSGAVVPNIPVVLKNVDKGGTRNATTTAQGAYQFLQLQPGFYEVSAEAQGFSPAKRRLNLLVDTPATIDLTLKMAGTSAQVDVVAAAPTVNTQDATIGNAVTQTQIDSLPFEGRDPLAVLTLQPGVTFVGNNVDTSYDTRQGAVAGARSDQTNVTLDGVDNNDDAGFGQPFQGALRTPLDSIQELRMVTSNSNADAGRSSGAQVIEVTRSGGNQFHGSLYEYNRGLVRTANDWFNKESEIQAGLPNVPGKLIRNTFGARVGGPIIKDRLFFFANYEGQRTRESQQVTRIVPTSQLRSGVVRYRTCGASSDCTGLTESVYSLTPQQLASTDQACVANGTCPWGGGADPNVISAWSAYPLPNQFNSGDGLNFAGFTFAAPVPAKLDTYLVRLDVNLTANGNHRLFIKPQMQNDHLSDAPQFPGQPASTVTTNNSKGISVGYTAVLTNTLINNFRYGYIRQGIGVSGTQSQPVVQFRGLDQPFAVTSTSYHIVPVNNYVDDVSWVRGKHTLQFGVNLRMVKNLLATNANSFFSGLTNTSWIVNSGLANQGSSLDPAAFGFPAVANDFANNYDNPVTALAGLVSEVGSNYNRDKTGAVLGQGVPAARRFKANEFETYVQDQWHTTPNLTLTAGVRYTYLQTPYESNGTEVIPSVSLHDWFMARGQAMFNQQGYAPPVSYMLGGAANHAAPYWNADKANFAPRLALAYSPGFEHGLGGLIFGGPGKSSFRMGYGMYYDHFGEGLVNSFDRFGSFGLATQLGNSASVQTVDDVPRFSGLNNIPQSLVIAAPAGGFPYTPPSGPDAGGFGITWGLDDHIHTPYSHVFSAGFQRELPKRFVFEVNYVGRLGRHLLQEIDLAMPENVKDKASGMTYFQAATMFAQAYNAKTPLSQIKNIPYWQNLFPNAPAGFYASGGGLNFGCAPGAAGFTGTPTATQAMYDMYSCNIGNETSALFNADVQCAPACSTLGQYGYFDSQFSSLYA